MPDTHPDICCAATARQKLCREEEQCFGSLPVWTYQSNTAQLQPGDMLLLSTDGITEAENAQLEEFGDQRLLHAARARDGSALEIQRVIMQQVTAFCGGNFRDDATLLVLRIT
jgi:phosphoserine phosphatase RsbU/P